MSDPGQSAGGNWFQRTLLPGVALKAVIIGGGYATGRELAEFFLPAGPWGGLMGMVLAMLIWSLVAAITFALAQRWQTLDYRAFFRRLRQERLRRHPSVCPRSWGLLASLPQSWPQRPRGKQRWRGCSAMRARLSTEPTPFSLSQPS
jgi:hypothetical protein